MVLGVTEKDRQCAIVSEGGDINVLNRCGSEKITFTQGDTEVVIEGKKGICDLRRFILAVCSAKGY
jgi:hypothetical protein